MNYFSILLERTRHTLEQMALAGEIPSGLDLGLVSVEPCRNKAHGDVATNAALVLAKPSGQRPQELAQSLATRLSAYEDTDSAMVAGPGFLNLTLCSTFWHEQLSELLRLGSSYGRGNAPNGVGPINVEYVSANPTGPMHVGHARGAVFGDALASVLEFAGYHVTREYFINDAGSQVRSASLSVLWHAAFPEDLPYTKGFSHEHKDRFFVDTTQQDRQYGGEYITQLGDRFRESCPQIEDPEWPGPQTTTERIIWFSQRYEPLAREFVLQEMMESIRQDLLALGVRHDKFTSERELVAAGRTEEVLERLRAKNLIYEGTLDPPKGINPEDYENREQTLFRSSDFGDDVDRPVRKSDGSWTYFATDMAYHADKIDRSFESLINVWGADHSGYISRMQAAVEALSEGKTKLNVKLCQMVKLLRRGQPVKMSKRSGNFVTLRDVVDEVGKDVVRFIMLTRRNDAPLEFDFSVVTEESRENPVFYVQYAHARCHSVLRNAAEIMQDIGPSLSTLAVTELGRLTHPDEIALIKALAGWPRTIEAAVAAHEPHRIAFYLRELAACFHTLWTRGKEDNSLRFLIPNDEPLSSARLALVTACAQRIAEGLRIIGVTPVEELR